MATFTAVEQRAYIKIEYYRDTKRVKILNTLKSVCGKDALPKTTPNYLYYWTTNSLEEDFFLNLKNTGLQFGNMKP